MKVMSAKGSLKMARDPHFQALFAVRGVMANAFKMTEEQVFGPKGNEELKKLFKVLGTGHGASFDLSRCLYDKIIFATDADIDGLNIRSLGIIDLYCYGRPLIEDGRVYIAEPPLYRVNSKKNPFVVNKAEYTSRYCSAVSKDYRVGYRVGADSFRWIDRKSLEEVLNDTRYYAEDLQELSSHYRVNDRLMEMILEEAALLRDIPENLASVMNVEHLMNEVNAEFQELVFDVKRGIINGSIDGTPQTIGITKEMVTRADIVGLMDLIRKYKLPNGEKFILHSTKSKSDQMLSLLEILKVLRKYQPDILHRFKGLGENDYEDIRTTVMDPNTRSLIRVTIGDIANNAEVFKMLRGDSPIDRLNRREAYMNFKFDRDDIDT